MIIPDSYHLADLRQSQVQELHRDRIARVYAGEVSDAETRRRARDRIEWMVQECDPGRVLDIGCSEGIFAVRAAEEGRTVRGIDIHPEAIEYARSLATERLGPDAAERVVFEVVDLFALERIEPEYDTVVLGEVLEHVYEPGKMLRRAALALRAGGTMVVTTPWGYFPAPDHHQTFFLTTFLELLPDVMEWTHLSITDGYILFTAVKSMNPGEGDPDELRQRNRDRFPPSMLLEESERAALASQEFLRNALELRHGKWLAAVERAERLASEQKNTQKQLESLSAAASAGEKQISFLQQERDAIRRQRDVMIAEKKGEREQLEVSEQDRERQKRVAQVTTLEQQLSELRQERDAIRKQRDLLHRSTGNIPLALKLALRRKAVPFARRARAYVEARPRLKMHLMRTAPPALLHRLNLLSRASAAPGIVLAAPAERPPQADLIRAADAIEVPQTHVVIICCNSYPDGSGNYGGEFVRARVHGYASRGISSLVIARSNRYWRPELRRVEGTDLLCCPPALLDQMMEIVARHPANAVFVHSPAPELLLALCGMPSRERVSLFFHGYEVRDYRRLAYNFSTEELELNRSRLDALNHARFAALRTLDRHPEIRSVFVSNYLLGVARADSGAELRNASVIPNYIDGEFFSAHQKAPETARQILLVRSFAARNYANDIAVEALRILAEEPEFEQLRITIRGTGRFFAPLMSTLAGFRNVDAKEVYLSPKKIKTLHDAHGLFLAPSRYDTQGVTMCEAMASGLVCVTNPVAGIPEYIDETCGYFT